MWIFYVIVIFNIYQIEAAGQVCTKNGMTGTCTKYQNCDSAAKREEIQKCGYDSDSEDMVCCYDKSAIGSEEMAVGKTTPKSNNDDDYSSDSDSDELGDCPPVEGNRIETPKSGKKAWQKCMEYQDKLVYPCMRSLSLMPGKERRSFCQHKAKGLIVGGKAASQHEFPHMVLLGYNSRLEPHNTNISRIEWLCGGSLISERYVLTAAHCLWDHHIRNVKYVYVGADTRVNTLDASGLYTVKRRIKYPSYNPPSKYDDIALLELNKDVPLDENTVPACLPFGVKINETIVTATGWGVTQYRGFFSNQLQKVNLNKFSSIECYAHFPPDPLSMEFGFDEDSQLCYGDKLKSKDTCQGDSGGPIQIKSENIKCMYVIVGVTSFGRACGFVGEPAIYTKVSAYLSWIEKIVWP
ncbi:hypothetical protein K1T71_014678 [Dendrolimus kikuchii]|uniref:Uncharacterized protein n=1 Tax=Dendrolimus kikuchii TaxID=765133 RepID=A0ACC1CES1_9NEOP|nr:hypothetical protein K1T71_014678 [Dendrolimus kikuchii]